MRLGHWKFFFFNLTEKKLRNRAFSKISRHLAKTKNIIYNEDNLEAFPIRSWVK